MSTHTTDAGHLKVARATNIPQTADGQRKTANGKFTLAQLRQTDAVVPLQSGTNQFDSQKGKTSFGMPRNTQTSIEFGAPDKNWGIQDPKGISDIHVRLQSGTNLYESQKGMTSFGMPRDVRGNHIKRIWELEFPEEAIPEDQRFPQPNQQKAPQ
uniref:Calponin family repeat-containing domain protein n=1 Tax=Rhabditophanes sp. KR3021 TaxID=114890 RepID=A0AC35TU09_9BILA